MASEDKSTIENARVILGEAGLRRTRQRVDIVCAMLEGEGPMSQEQITGQIAGEAPNKATIYRAMESLMDKGVVHRAFERDGVRYFELGHHCSEHQCHPHFTCTSCKKTHCLTDFEVPMVQSQLGFEVTHQKIELEGLCPGCCKKHPRD